MLSSRPGKSAGDQIKKCMVTVYRVAIVVILCRSVTVAVVVVVVVVIVCVIIGVCILCVYVCVKVQEVQSSRSPPPTSTTEQKTRPPPLHTRYPLVSTSIEDLFYRSLVQTRSRTRSMRGQHYFRLIYGSGRFYGSARLRAHAATRRTDTPTRRVAPVGERRSAKFADLRGSLLSPDLRLYSPRGG